MAVVSAELIADFIDEEHQLLLGKLAEVGTVCAKLDVEADCTACTVAEQDACIDRVTDVLLDTVLTTIIETTRTAKVGDGKIFVTNLPEVFKIRTGESGEEAL